MMPDSFELKDIAAQLSTRFVGRQVEYHDALPSTMMRARELALSGAPEGALVLAEVQTAGTGRLARRWHTPSGNIALSLILRPPTDRLPYLVMLAALAVTDAVRRVTGIDAEIKWPNDVLIGGKKVCGMLAQTEFGAAPFAVLGIGLNVNLEPADFEDIREIATSLNIAAGQPVDRALLLRTLLEEIERLYLSLDAPQAVFDAWRGRLITLGKEVTVSCPGDVFRGVAEDVAADGGLLVRTPDGEVRHVLAGDVTLT